MKSVNVQLPSTKELKVNVIVAEVVSNIDPSEPLTLNHIVEEVIDAIDTRTRSDQALTEAISLMKRSHQKLRTFTAIYSGDKELVSILESWNKFINDHST